MSKPIVLSSSFPMSLNEFPSAPSPGIFGSSVVRGLLDELRTIHPKACAILSHLYYNCTGPTYNWSASELAGFQVRLSGTEIATYLLYDRSDSLADMVLYGFAGSMSRTSIAGTDKTFMGLDTSNVPLFRSTPVPPSSNFTGNQLAFVSFSEFPNSSVGERPWSVFEIFYDGIFPVDSLKPFKTTAVWQKFIRSNDSPYAFQNDPTGAPGNALVLGETLLQSGRISNYKVFQTTLFVHTSAPLHVDQALGQVRSGTDIVYQCPIDKRFIACTQGNLTLTAARTFSFLRCVTPNGTLIPVPFTGTAINANNIQVFNVIDIQLATAIGIPFSILEFDNIPDIP